jgi:hypothetical protein
MTEKVTKELTDSERLQKLHDALATTPLALLGGVTPRLTLSTIKLHAPNGLPLAL